MILGRGDLPYGLYRIAKPPAPGHNQDWHACKSRGNRFSQPRCQQPGRTNRCPSAGLLTKMKVSRQPKVSALFRIFAMTCALLWLAGIAVSSLVCGCNCAGDEEDCAADARPIHEHDAGFSQERGYTHTTASHHDDGETQQGHCGKNGCGEQCRCAATIQGFVQTPPVFIFPKPVSQPVLNISVSCTAREHVFAAPPSEALRRAKPRDWVFTPVVCLGPAFRSLAPPVLI
jgi:hypothetical protein